MPSRAIAAMGIALARLEIVGCADILAGLAASDLGDVRRSEMLRRLIAAASIVWANEHALSLLGLDASDLPVPAAALWPFSEAAALASALSTTERGDAFFHAELCLRNASGAFLHVNFHSWREPEAADGELTVGLEDIRPQVRARDALTRLHSQMAHADRLSTLGVMTATIAHEVRQPLGAIVNSAGAALRWMRRDPPDLDQIRDCLLTVEEGAIKASETVARLRTMSSNRIQERESCDIGLIIGETAAFLKQEFTNRQTEVALDIDEDIPPITSDRVQIRQVLVNLMMNAAQAMADAQCWTRSLKVRARHDGTVVVVDVEDSGPGIPDTDRERLFEGFYTTKAAGLGLGLPICRLIAEEHGGTLEHIDKPAGGSIFRFEIPVSG